ncbi:Protein of unknown function (DUF3176) domain containing protein [Rhypophila decipiens]
MDTDSTRSYPLCHDCDSEKMNEKKTPHSYDRKSWWSKACETWIFEFAGLIIGFLCLAATLSLLGVYNRKTVPDWPVTLNFALSLIGNVGFAATIFGVHGAVAQYKWILYSGDPRPLSQLGIFQRVRSSALGALELLYELGNHLTLMAGGLAIVLGMFWGPFTQNLIRYEIGPVISTDDIALLARNVHYRAHGQVTRGGYLDVDPMLQLNMLNSLAAAPNLDVNVPDYVCPTGNCTWPPAATQAFCSRCTDLTSQIVLDCKERDHKGVSIQTCLAKIPSSGCSLLSNSLWDADESFLNITQLDPETLRYHAIQRVSGAMVGPSDIIDITPSKAFVYTRPFVTKAEYTATECWLRPCVRSFEASVINGIYKETVLRTFMPDLKQWWGMPIQPKGEAADGIYAIRNRVNLTMFSMLPGSDIAGTVEIESYNRLFSSFVGSVETADGHNALSFRGSEPGSTEYSERRTVASSMLKMILNNTFSASDCGSPNDDTFACVVDALAQALTKTLRNSGMREHRKSAVSEEDAVKGTVYTTATFVRAQWYWIGLPVAVWLLGMFTSVVIVLRSRAMKLPTWKDDLLPLVFLYNRERLEGRRNSEWTSGMRHEAPI